MEKETAFALCRFIAEHWDMVSQEEYFELCDLILRAVLESGPGEDFGYEVVSRFPELFGFAGGDGEAM